MGLKVSYLMKKAALSRETTLIPLQCIIYEILAFALFTLRPCRCNPECKNMKVRPG